LGEPEPEQQQRQVDVRVGSATNALAPVYAAGRSLAAGPRQWAGLVTVVSAALFSDQLTKWIVTSELRLDESVQVLGPFELHRVQNSGIAFGLFASATSVVIVLTTVAVAWMLLFFARSGARHPVIPAGLGLLIGGSVANLADRVRLGHVTDFLDLGWWPAFNLADTFIVLGVAILLAGLFAADARPRRARRHLDVAR
jgi:signal peptidase II